MAITASATKSQDKQHDARRKIRHLLGQHLPRRFRRGTENDQRMPVQIHRNWRGKSACAKKSATSQASTPSSSQSLMTLSTRSKCACLALTSTPLTECSWSAVNQVLRDDFPKVQRGNQCFRLPCFHIAAQTLGFIAAPARMKRRLLLRLGQFGLRNAAAALPPSTTPAATDYNEKHHHDTR
jgi:hypothetical protein